MAALPIYASPRQSKPQRLSLCGGLVLLLATATLYAVVALRYSHAASLPFSWITPQHGTAGTTYPISDKQGEDSDRFALHPELHISRSPRTLRFDWNVTRQPARPDGVLRDVYLINGQFIGPTIEARSGDELQITVTNNIFNDTDAGLAMHWHGLLMNGANEMDGVTGVTQCGIAEGQSFTYKFRIDPKQHGTYWYHAHSAVKRADGLYGGLIIHRPVDNDTGETDLSRHEYDAERLLLISDWYHRDADTVLSEYKDFTRFAYEPAADSLLINGVGSYNCSMAVPARPVDCIETETPEFHMIGDKAIRLRIVNTGAAAGLSFQLGNGTMQLLTVDGGGYISNDTPKTPTMGVLYPGERMDVLLLPDETPANDAEHILNTQLKIVLDVELMRMKNWALERIQDFPLKWSKSSASGSHVRKDVRKFVDIFNVKDAQGAEMPASSSIHNAPADTALLYTSMSINSFKENEPWAEVNRTSWVWKDPQAKPLLAIDRDEWADGTEQANPLRTFRSPWYESGQDRWIDLVVNNVDDRGHPFHLHGYAFYVIAARQLDIGRYYNPHEPGATEKEAEFFNTQTPLLKDTVYIPSHGYVALRFPANNPGVWLMHCHVLWHQAVGMGVVLQIGNTTEATKEKASQTCIA
ncbi:hypothetical protein NLG97_g4007 [Lecanicillium saksenae]|uniref:Uncharacterized protein n=1 Tax=Lecanicillium saksenae TaxID=468837 RepID=A0ACC1QWK7_9HYPO|nr:hypothetical protein NLG97_g4007 [Lecanicillium saksenae]